MGRYYEDFTIGQEFVSQRRTVTETDVVNFAGVSGDFNALHMDEETGRASPYGERIAHGLLVLSMVSGLKSKMDLTEGTALAFLGLKWDFRDSVRFGDTIHFVMKIIEKRPTKRSDAGLIKQSIQVFNQKGRVVQEGEHTLLILHRPTETVTNG